MGIHYRLFRVVVLSRGRIHRLFRHRFLAAAFHLGKSADFVPDHQALSVSVKKMLADRQSEVEETYRAAEEAKTSALAMQAEYEAHLKNAKEEAGELVRSATKKAQLRGEEIIAEAHQKSAGILKKAEEQIENEKKKAVNEIKNDISDMAFLVAGQVVEKELDTKEHQRLIESFIDDIDDLQMSDRQS